MTFEQGLLTALIAGAISIVSIWLDKKFFSLQFEKKIADFNFFIKKKHEVYPELFAKVMKTTNEAKGIQCGMEIIYDFIGSEANENDIVEYMTAHQFPNGKKETILQLWKNNKVSAQQEIHSLVKTLKYQRVKENWLEADEYYRKSIIYLSDELKDNLEVLFDKLTRLNGFYAGIFTGRKETVEQVTKEMDAVLKKVIEVMKKEMQKV